MIDMKKADIYLDYLDKILAGKEDIGPVEDEEIEKLLLLAKVMIAADFSIGSRIKENLKKQLLEQLAEMNDDQELDEEDLEHVVAAGSGQYREQRDICPYCGSKVLAGKCILCNHALGK